MALVIVAVAMGLLSGWVAYVRGLSLALFFVGLVLGPIGVALALFSRGGRKLPADISMIVLGISLALAGCYVYLSPGEVLEIISRDQVADYASVLTARNSGLILLVFGGVTMLPGLWARAAKG